jgi:di/tricarboxylate transporter
MATLGTLAYALVLIGGILMLLFGILSLLGIPFSFGPAFGWGFYSFAWGSIITLICGVIAIVGARKVNSLVWAIALIIVGIIGGTIGGILVFIGALIALIAVLVN